MQDFGRYPLDMHTGIQALIRIFSRNKASKSDGGMGEVLASAFEFIHTRINLANDTNCRSSQEA